MRLFDRLRGNPSKDGFAERVSAALRRAGDTREIAYDPQEFQLVFSDEGKPAGIANLANAYVQYCQTATAERDAYLSRVVRAMLSFHKEIPEEYVEALPDILPSLRNRSYYELVGLRELCDEVKATDWPYQVVGEHFALGLVYDLPESMRGIRQNDLDDWGVTFFEALEAACGNLRQREFAVGRLGDGLYFSAVNDGYDPARLMLLDVIAKLEVKGEPIAMIPTRTSMFFTGSDDVDGLGAMAELAGKVISEEAGPMSAVALRLDGDAWIPWLPEPSHPHFARYKELELGSLANDYREQKQLLEAYYEKKGIDEFVASYSAVKSKQGELLSYCLWVEGIPSLLPRADTVLFVRSQGADEGEVVSSGSWEHVRRTVGHLMQEQDLYPVRYRVTDFPGVDQLQAIGAFSL